MNTLFAVVAGGWIPGSSLEPFFSLTKNQTVLALVIYGFVAAVLPVWLLLGPRDYLSSFLKIGTVILLVGSVCIANPPLHAPAFNQVFNLQFLQNALDSEPRHLVFDPQVGFAGEAIPGLVTAHLDLFAQFIKNLPVLGEPVGFGHVHEFGMKPCSSTRQLGRLSIQIQNSGSCDSKNGT